MPVCTQAERAGLRVAPDAEADGFTLCARCHLQLGEASMATTKVRKKKAPIKRAPVIPPVRGAPKKRRAPGRPPVNASCGLPGPWYPLPARLHWRTESQPTVIKNELM
jgi:hypothetical protein